MMHIILFLFFATALAWSFIMNLYGVTRSLHRVTIVTTFMIVANIAGLAMQITQIK
jgi:hypothetical protein